jgi:hypothetical protein
MGVVVSPELIAEVLGLLVSILAAIGKLVELLRETASV